MSERRCFPIYLLLLVQMQIVILLSHNSYSESPSTTHTVMLDHFKHCKATWREANSIIHEEIYRCAGETEERGTVYSSSFEAGRWKAYAWGVEEKEFDTREQAKNYIETQIAYWLRPKA